jgi:hypothetical protein
MTGREVDLTHAAAMPAPQGGALPTGLEWQALERMAGMLADSSLIPYKLRGKPGDIAVVLLAAREYGIPPLMALSKLPVVNGTPAPMGELMVALVLRAGHRITVSLHNPDGTPFGGVLDPGTYASCKTRRAGDTDDEVLNFTLGEAIQAGLVEWVNGKPHARDSKNQPLPWEQYTGNMLRWRAVANACRLRFPDVLLGLSYLPEELGAVVDAEGRPIDLGEAERVTPPRTGPSSTLEERTAAEWLDKLDEQPWADVVLEQVLANATEGGFIDVEVMRPGGKTTVRQAVDAHRVRRDEMVTATVNPIQGDATATVVPESGPATPPEEPATAPPAAQEHEPAPTATPEDSQPVTAAPEEPANDVPGLTAEDVAVVMLEESDPAILKAAWTDAKAAGLLEANIIDVLTLTDATALGMPADLTEVKLGALGFEVNRYVKAQGAAVRAPVSADPSDPEDPWADRAGDPAF